jgi:uncharacterized protein YndB with AHSA1/START domain
LTPRGVSSIFLYIPELGHHFRTNPFINNSFEPIMKMTLGTAVCGVVPCGGCKHFKHERRKPMNAGKNKTTVERKSDLDLVVTRTFNAPAHIVFEAWTTPDLFKRWWAPKSGGMTIVSCDMDVRVGGGYRLAFGHPASEQPMAFFGKYIEVNPNKRLVWTNEESADAAVTTLTFAENSGKTLLVLHECYPTKEALDDGISGMECMPEQFGQLDELLVTLAKR